MFMGLRGLDETSNLRALMHMLGGTFFLVLAIAFPLGSTVTSSETPLFFLSYLFLGLGLVEFVLMVAELFEMMKLKQGRRWES